MKHTTAALLMAILAYASTVYAATPVATFDTGVADITAGAIKLTSEELMLPHPVQPHPIEAVAGQKANTSHVILGITLHGTTQQEMLKEALIQYLSKASADSGHLVALLSRKDTEVRLNKNTVLIAPDKAATPLHTITNTPLVNTLRIIAGNTSGEGTKAALICEFVEVVVVELLWKVIEGSWTQVWVETKKLVKECREADGPITEPQYTNTGSSGPLIPVRNFYLDIK